MRIEYISRSNRAPRVLLKLLCECFELVRGPHRHEKPCHSMESAPPAVAGLALGHHPDADLPSRTTFSSEGGLVIRLISVASFSRAAPFASLKS